MKIKADLLRISNATHDQKGNKLEPEERPAERVLVTELGVTSTDPNALPDAKQGIRGEIAVQTTAGELAQSFKSMCFSCRHFDQKAWLLLRRKWEHGTIEEQRQLNSVRAALIDTQNADVQSMVAAAEEEGDIDAALSTMGICRAITEAIREPMIVHATATCPENMPYFQAKDVQAEKNASAAFDDIMRRAQGKK